MNKKPKFKREGGSWNEFASAAVIGYMSSCSLHDEPMVWTPKIAEMAAELAEEEFPQYFQKYPDLIVKGDPVAGYQNYYKVEKKSFGMRGRTVFASWTKRETPSFML